MDRVRGDFVGVDNDAGMRPVLEHLVDELALDADEHLIGTVSIEAGRQAATDLLARKSLPEAVVAGSDLIAIGLIARLRQSAVRVPRDLLVTGFDGTVLSEVYEPALTTVPQPLEAIARNAVSFLTSRISGPQEPTSDSRIGATLMVRESSSPPR